MTFLLDARQADARPPQRLRQVHRSGRDRKRGRVEMKMRRNDPVGHLIVLPAADAVDELVDDEEAEEHGERQGARREAEIVSPEPLRQASSGVKAVGGGVEVELLPAWCGDDISPALARERAGPRAIAGR